MKRPAILRKALEVLAEHLLGLTGAAGVEQNPAELLTHRHRPFGRLAVYCDRNSFTTLEPMTRVCDPATMTSLLSRSAPRLRATCPPHGSMFSLRTSAQLTRTPRFCVGVIRWSTLARNWFDVKSYGTLPVSTGKPLTRRMSAAVPTGCPKTSTMFSSSMVTKLLVWISRRSNERKKKV